jgi:predicted nucleic acid-binding protein
VLVSALLDDGEEGRWAEDQLLAATVLVPHLAPAEVSNVLRRAVLNGTVPPGIGGIAHADLQRMPLDLYPFAPFADRVWQLRDNVTSYDAWYVAIAEWAGCPLVTLDRRLSAASGPRCLVVVPDR